MTRRVWIASFLCFQTINVATIEQRICRTFSRKLAKRREYTRCQGE